VTKAKTQAEKRNDLLRQVDELDAARVEAVREIFQRPELQQALVDLQALADPTDQTAFQRVPTADVNAMVVGLSLPMQEAMKLADFHAAVINQRLNPPQPQTPAQTDPNAPENQYPAPSTPASTALPSPPTE